MPEASRPKPVRKKRKRVTKIFVCSGGEKLGPFSRQEVGRALAAGTFKLDDLAWFNRLTEWVPLHHLPTTSAGEDGVALPMPAVPAGILKTAEELEKAGRRRRSTARAEETGWQARLMRFFGRDKES